MIRKHINRATLLGYVSTPPSLRHSSKGSPYVRFTLTTTFTDRNHVTRSTHHNIFAFEIMAVQMSQVVFQHQILYIEGPIQIRDWQDTEPPHTRHRRVEIRVEKFSIVDRSRESSSINYSPPPDQLTPEPPLD